MFAPRIEISCSRQTRVVRRFLDKGGYTHNICKLTRVFEIVKRGGKFLTQRAPGELNAENAEDAENFKRD